MEPKQNTAHIVEPSYTPLSRRMKSGSWRMRCGEISMVSAPAEWLFHTEKTFCHVVTVNAEIFVMAHENSRFQHLLKRTVNTIDGRVLRFICMLLYPGNEIRLLKGADFVYDLAAWCQRNRERLFLLGSNADSNTKAVLKLRGRYPGLEVEGFGPPLAESPFQESCRRAIFQRIQLHRPHHLVVCFGPPKQEFWISENSAELAALGVKRAYGLGGTIDFVSGLRRRAPRWLDVMGGEWLFRWLCEPRVRFRRTLIQFKMPLYAAKTVREMIAFPDTH
jgi:N-acetylglucosaminyldiphosphoundecaprenol N-acetyl-beta-D-mannosaminyltransferase